MKSSRLRREMPLYGLLLVPVLITFLYSYLPMAGIVMAFQDFRPSVDGFFTALATSPFVGFAIFQQLFENPDATVSIYNTVFISLFKIVLKILAPLVLALLLNEVRRNGVRNAVSTIVYLPYFLSWVVLGGILKDFFSPTTGAFNAFIGMFGAEPTFVFGSADAFPWAVIVSDVWQQMGYNTIVFLAALTAVDLSMYEAAIIDGAGRLKQVFSITLPTIAPIVILVSLLSLNNLLNAGQDQIMNLYNPAVYSTGDIIDTYTFRNGIQQGQYSVGTALGLFKSVISASLIWLSYALAKKYTGYKVF